MVVVDTLSTSSVARVDTLAAAVRRLARPPNANAASLPAEVEYRGTVCIGMGIQRVCRGKHTRYCMHRYILYIDT